MNLNLEGLANFFYGVSAIFIYGGFIFLLVNDRVGLAGNFVGMGTVFLVAGFMVDFYKSKRNGGV